MNNTVIFRKKVFGTARLNVRFPNANVLLLATLEGGLLQEKLEEAIVRVSKKHLLMNSNINVDADNTVWYEINSGMKPAVYCTQDTEDLDKIMIAELKTPFNLEEGPLVRFNIIGTEDKTYLLISCHHAICDGLSLVYLANDLLTAIAYPEKEINGAAKLIVQDERAIPDKVKNGFLMKLMINSMNKKWQKRDLPFTKVMYNDIHTEFWKKHHPGIIRWGLSKEQTSKLVKQSKKNGVTVNTALATAFVRAQNEILDRQFYSDDVTVSVSMRDYLEESPEDAMGFFASAVRPALKYSIEKSFWDNAVKFHKQIKSLMTEKNIFDSQVIGFFNPKFLDALVLGRYGRNDDKTVRKMIARKKMDVINTAFTLSNLGRVNVPADFDGLKLTSLMGPVVYGDSMEKYIGVITINGQMFFSISFNQDIVGKDKMEELKNKVIEYIEQM